MKQAISQRLQVVNEILHYYVLNNKVMEKCFIDPEVMAFFSFETGNIEICISRLNTKKEFILSVLHEIHHAIQARKMGLNRFANEYNKESDKLLEIGKDDYWFNIYEKEAEEFAKREYRKWRDIEINLID